MLNMSGDADIVVVHHPKGAVALVWVDLSVGAVVTTHAGLRNTLRRGLRGWAGQIVQTRDGHIFLSAVYDHFFLKGYRVHWFSAPGVIGTHPSYRV
ncbi:MAG: hypothetical protein MRJ68_03215 [Nitrospira sp.]|nr:hypothetical protein [Nitrospira sp.]